MSENSEKGSQECSMKKTKKKLSLVFDSVCLYVHMSKPSNSQSHGNEFLTFIFINELAGLCTLIHTNNAETEGHVCSELTARPHNWTSHWQSQPLVFICPFQKKKKFSSLLISLFYLAPCSGVSLYEILLISPPLFSLHLHRHRRLRARLEEVPRPLLQVWIMKNHRIMLEIRQESLGHACLLYLH